MGVTSEKIKAQQAQEAQMYYNVLTSVWQAWQCTAPIPNADAERLGVLNSLLPSSKLVELLTQVEL